MINIKSFTFNPFGENAFFLWDEERSCVAIDPGFLGAAEAAAVKEFLASEDLKLKAVWLTHCHFDHIYGVKALQSEHSVPVFLGGPDCDLLPEMDSLCALFGLPAPAVDFEVTLLHDGDVLDMLKGSPFKALASPGHSSGGFCFYDETDKVLFSGDTLFAGSLGRSDLPGGDYDKLIVSIMDGLMGLPGDVDVLPGHGPRTTIAEERTNNPFLQPFNEPEPEGFPDGDAAGIELHPFD